MLRKLISLVAQLAAWRVYCISDQWPVIGWITGMQKAAKVKLISMVVPEIPACGFDPDA